MSDDHEIYDPRRAVKQNPYESPHTPLPARRANLPFVVLFSFNAAVWAIFGGLMLIHIYDEAAGNMPREV